MIYGVEAAAPNAISAGPYVASAVHFAGSQNADGETYLDCSSLSCGTDNGKFAFSFWQKDLVADTNAWAVLWTTDPAITYYPFFGMYPNMAWRFPTDYSTYWNVTGATWSHIMGSAETNQAAGSKVKVLYVNDVLQTPDFYSDTGAAFISALDGKRFVFGDDTYGNGPTCDLADVWIAPNVALHDGTGLIPEATRRQFIAADFSPVNPSGWPASAVQFYGDATAFGTNRGTGGSFSLTGSLTDAGTHP